MIIIQYDLENIDVAYEISDALKNKISEPYIFIPKNFWVLQNVEKEYLTHIRDEINKILESGDDNAL